jgi:glycine cleavage system aminomethyltransferase T
MFTADTEALAEPGTTTASLLLTGEAEIIDVVLIIRTGDNEYMVTTNPSTANEAFAWLEAHAKIRDDEGALFENLAITNETEKLAGVVLFGKGSTAVLDELAGQPLAAFPHVGHLTMAQLDTVPALILDSPLLPTEAEAYELFCPPASVQGLIHALLSFPEIDPLDTDEYRALREQQGTWFAQADEAAYSFPDETGLMRLVRASMDFVGGQALAKRLNNV